MQDDNLWLLLIERALESTAEGVVISNCKQTDMPIIYVNRAFTQMTGYEYDEVVGQNCRFLQGPDTDNNNKQIIREALKDECPCIVEILNYRKDGTPFWNRLSITPVKNDQGDTTHFIGIQSDITRRRQAEELLQQANEQLNRDLQAAAVLQQAQLPKKLPQIQGYRFAWQFRPCQKLAGDMLNFLQLDDTHVSMYVLDVMGHGIKSALQSFSLSQDLRPRQDGPNLISPENILERLNLKYPMDIDTGMFFTILYGVIDTQTGGFTYCSAGHPGPILLKKGEPPRIIETQSYPVGIIPEPEYGSRTIYMEEEDKLIMYTDGLVEAMNIKGEPFNEDRLLNTLHNNRNLAIDDLLKVVIISLEKWICNVNLKDDISLVAFEAV